MCYHLSMIKEREYVERRFEAAFIEPMVFEPLYHVSAFLTPYIPVICNSDVHHIQLFQWGLIPFWVKDDEKAAKIRFSTFNARAETIFEKPSFKFSIKKKRCIVLADGFYEWREVDGKKYPYYIRFVDQRAFALAGIWETWDKSQTEGVKRTFSIITTRANPLIEKIHKKKRMPVILKQQDEKRWLSENLDTNEINSMLKPFDDKEMEVYPISKLITVKGANTNIPEVINKFEYKNVNLDI